MVMHHEAASSQVKRYALPTHLNVPDKIAIPLLGLTIQVTMRQGLIFLCGWSFALNFWRQLSPLDQYGTPGVVIHLIIPAILIVVTAVVAMLRVADRHLEQWLAIMLRYRRQPKVYLWHPVNLLSASNSGSLSDLSPNSHEEEE